MIRGIVGNGRKVRFWIDPWITSKPLKDLYPDLFRLEENKWCYVDAIIGSQHHGRGITWKWKKQPALGSEVDALIDCHKLVADVVIDEKDDRWFWNHGPNVEFSVRDVRKWLKGADVLHYDSRFTWCKWLPNKCNIFMWRANMDRIPTLHALRRRNIYVGEGMCVFCGEAEETSDHLFSACRLVDGVWNGIASWCKIYPFFVFSTNDVLQIVKHVGGSKAKQDIIYGVIILTCWRIWNARNEKVFTSKDTNVAQIISDVKSLGYLWFRGRHKGGSIEWKDWCNFYFPMM
ncbi:reverse transcriptase domain, Reverse transcriptase zinc-binding domain protein [Artemisia annua]|uniref:Reverse transcriptase domain, Reverse transcriptase zinc-binding domain protein n=1 Tax=Artemisia annua TaxID=35608 RepID=A0A2U1KE67_ARTAN|nr:reverse transcriptase domain, Reverse transcriptase zinc-binding domain protein [Artemisia annua]